MRIVDNHFIAASTAVTSSVVTLKLASVQGPNEVTIATSVASRPRAIKMRPMRGTLLRHQKCTNLPRGRPQTKRRNRQEDRGRNADIAKIASTIARRNIHTPAKGDGEVGKIPAHAALLIINLPCRHGWVGVLVAERYVVVNVVADSLYERPTFLQVPEK